MLTFSTDPDVAEQQMNAIIFYLTAFGSSASTSASS